MKFVRQEPVGPYIVDFICREQRLVVEVDGGQHAESSRDAIRDQWLRNHGYRVLRFWNNDVIANIDGVLEAIADILQRERHPRPVLGVGKTDLFPHLGRGESHVSERAPTDVAHALKDAAVAGLIAFGMFLPLIGFHAVQDMRNELVLETRWPLLAVFVILAMAGRLFGSLVVTPWRERRAAASRRRPRRRRRRPRSRPSRCRWRPASSSSIRSSSCGSPGSAAR